MLRRLIRQFSKLESQEDTFKLYIRKAETIDKEARERAEVLKGIRESLKATEDLDEVSQFIKNTRLLDKLFACRSSEKLQLVLEEAFHSVSKSFKDQEDKKKPELTPGSLTEKLMFVWDERPEIRLLDVPLVGLLRNIWTNSMTSTEFNFGTYKRITKEEDASYSPFFYGDIGDSVYISCLLYTSDAADE